MVRSEVNQVQKPQIAAPTMIASDVANMATHLDTPPVPSQDDASMFTSGPDTITPGILNGDLDQSPFPGGADEHQGNLFSLDLPMGVSSQDQMRHHGQDIQQQPFPSSISEDLEERKPSRMSGKLPSGSAMMGEFMVPAPTANMRAGKNAPSLSRATSSANGSSSHAEPKATRFEAQTRPLASRDARPSKPKMEMALSLLQNNADPEVFNFFKELVEDKHSSDNKVSGRSSRTGSLSNTICGTEVECPKCQKKLARSCDLKCV